MDRETKEYIDQQFERLHKKLNAHYQAEKTATWVKVTEIKRFTGWDKETMRRMRDAGLIKFRRSQRGFQYLLESIPQQLMKAV